MRWLSDMADDLHLQMLDIPLGDSPWIFYINGKVFEFHRLCSAGLKVCG
jgi:hypothetical protein